MKRFFWVVLVIIFFSSFQKSFAKEENSSQSASLTPVPVEYQLPYPGLLPDSPLYIIKIARDRIIGILISDSLKKAEFNLLQSDKRINASFYLSLKPYKKEELIISTFSKGENYFEKSISEIKKARSQGMETKDVSQRALLAVRKYQEITKEMKKSGSPELRKEILNLEKRLIVLEKEASL